MSSPEKITGMSSNVFFAPMGFNWAERGYSGAQSLES